MNVPMGKETQKIQLEEVFVTGAVKTDTDKPKETTVQEKRLMAP